MTLVAEISRRRVFHKSMCLLTRTEKRAPTGGGLEQNPGFRHRRCDEDMKIVVSREVMEEGQGARKATSTTFRVFFECVHDAREFVGDRCTDLVSRRLPTEDDDAVETLMNERFYHKPTMFYSPDKLIRSLASPRRRRHSSTTQWGRSPCRRKRRSSRTRSTSSPCAVQPPLPRAEVARYDNPVPGR